MQENNPPRAFVIMPFAEAYERVYTDIILPPFKDARWHVARSDKEPHLGLIPKRVLEGIAAADLVVAVISGYNPNVMYELGICHAFRKKPVLILSDSKDIPFDLAQFYYITYGQSEHHGVHEQIKRVIHSYHEGSLTIGNPVKTLLPNVFDYVFPVSPFDQLAMLRRHSAERLARLRSHVAQIRAIEDRVSELNENAGGFWGSLRSAAKNLVLAFSAWIFVRDLYGSAKVLDEDTAALLEEVELIAALIKEVIDYNDNLAVLAGTCRDEGSALQVFLDSLEKTLADLPVAVESLQSSVSSQWVNDLMEKLFSRDMLKTIFRIDLGRFRPVLSYIEESPSRHAGFRQRCREQVQILFGLEESIKLKLLGKPSRRVSANAPPAPDC